MNMKKYLFKILRTFLILVIVAICVINYSLYSRTRFQQNTSSPYNLDVVYQLNFLKAKIDEGEAIKMQQQFPEGFVFFYAMYGLAWSELIRNQPDSTDIFKRGLEEVSLSVDAIFSPQGKRTFTEDLPLKYGAYYRGWSNYLLAQKLKLTKASNRKMIDVERYQRNCREIAKAMEKSESPFLESYAGSSWPADMMVAVASVHAAKGILDTSYDKEVANWLEEVKKHLDPDGFIPHSTNTDGRVIENARGSSQALMLNFLVEMDSVLAKEQYQRFLDVFVEKHLGLQALREYPSDVVGQKGDIDSGPVIWDVGTVATIVGQHTYGKFGDWSRYQETKKCLDVIGLGYTSQKQKKYLLGAFPMADVFLAWSNALEPVNLKDKVTTPWRWKFQLISLALLLFLLFLLYLTFRKFQTFGKLSS